jgi:hypothetical protein
MSLNGSFFLLLGAARFMAILATRRFHKSDEFSRQKVTFQCIIVFFFECLILVSYFASDDGATSISSLDKSKSHTRFSNFLFGGRIEGVGAGGTNIYSLFADRLTCTKKWTYHFLSFSFYVAPS